MNDELPPNDHEGRAGRILGVAFTLLLVCIGALYFLRHQRESNRAGCIMNLRNVQQAVRSYQGMNGEDMGDPIDWSQIIGSGKFIEYPPECPSHGTYTFVDRHPPIGTLAAACSHAVELEHHPTSTTGW